MRDISLIISGMSCGHCLNAVTSALGRTKDVEVVTVRIGRADLRVQGPEAVEAAKTAIEDAGYRVDAVVGA